MTLDQWLLGSVAALLIGFSKTGMPGAGILVVPLLAHAFGARQSVGVMLPMLIFADVFAVVWYRRHAQWDKLIRLAPWVVLGMALGALALKVLGEMPNGKTEMGRLVGGLVLAMLAVHVGRKRWGDRLAPHSVAGSGAVGVAAGFTTTASNAAGPIMSIYLQSMGLPKDQFMGTAAWFFFVVNISKLPVFVWLTVANPANPIITSGSLIKDAMLCPIILAGVFLGRWVLPRVKQDLFDAIVLGLAGVAAIMLLLQAPQPPPVRGGLTVRHSGGYKAIGR
ncbi:MAG: sulfite exporter TauE/SafE family protein [Armatimonadetes bacterium]|nr:sulfite exporter TauE/SafE family protein [Armatimonadota bacterium]